MKQAWNPKIGRRVEGKSHLSQRHGHTKVIPSREKNEGKAYLIFSNLQPGRNKKPPDCKNNRFGVLQKNPKKGTRTKSGKLEGTVLLASQEPPSKDATQ